jgi:hypothetical protein
VDVIDLPPGDSPAGHAQLAELMRRLSEQYLPVNVTGDVEYMINRTSTGWIVALINNEGITKKGIGPVVLDPTKTQNVQLRLQRAALDAAREWRTNTTPQITDNAVTLTIPPGQIRIVELTTQR